MIVNKTAQNLTWNCLPLEVKKEVKRQYQIAINAKEYYTECTLEYLFGFHNLTSASEGEVMLTAMKWKVQEQYANYNKELQHDGLRHIEYEKAKEVVKVLYYLFGSKCLRDETCNVASNVASNIASSEPKPKPAEPKNEGTHSFSHILKDDFRDHNRLNIAAMAMQGILSNIDLFKNVLETGMETLGGDGISFRAVAKSSFLFADALINEAEEGGSK